MTKTTSYGDEYTEDRETGDCFAGRYRVQSVRDRDGGTSYLASPVDGNGERRSFRIFSLAIEWAGQA
jgi:hypothetical protein